jgi:hypothetical protein
MDELIKIIKILPYEIILLNFLKKTYNDEIRDFILKTNNYNIFIGYICKIINYYHNNTINLFRINNELYINNIYDYVIENNEIVPEIYNYIIDTEDEDLIDINKYLFNTIPEFIIIQEEHAEPKETKVFKDFILKKEPIFNIKSYINDNKLFNFFNYNLEIVILKDCVYFIHNKQKFIYKDGNIQIFDWNIDNTDKSILISVYRLIN